MHKGGPKETSVGTRCESENRPIERKHIGGTQKGVPGKVSNANYAHADGLIRADTEQAVP